MKEISEAERERRRKFSRASVRHGQYKTPEYAAWLNMRGRCLNPKHPNYFQYGGRGVAICERWNLFNNFIADMGKRPPGHTLERLVNSKGYSPDNCAWRTQAAQLRNTRRTRLITLNGETLCLKDWCARLGKPYALVIHRLHKNWTLDDALTTPIQTQYRKKSYANR